MSKTYRGKGQGLTKTQVRFTQEDRARVARLAAAYTLPNGQTPSASLLVSLALASLEEEARRGRLRLVQEGNQ
jgi:hypothetical protein